MFRGIIKKIKASRLNWKFTVVILISTAIPFSIMAAILFYNMRRSVIGEHINYMEHKIDQRQGQIETGMDSIHMSTQFFLTDEGLCTLLTRAAAGEKMATEELLDFYENEKVNLERLVNSNPLLYTVRAYAINDNVQEMMPILYKKSRMENLEWTNTGGCILEGWHFGYTDTTFSSQLTGQTADLAGLVSRVETLGGGLVGYIESAIPMKSMFPDLYEDSEDEWSCFVLEDGTVYFGTNEKEDSGELLRTIMEDPKDVQETLCRKIKGKLLVVTWQPVKDFGGTLISVQDITAVVGRMNRMCLFFAVIMILLLGILSVVVNEIVNRMLRQFYSILKCVHEVQKGDISIRIERHSEDEMGELACQLNRMLDRIQTLMEENINREVLAKNSEIRALQNQINAHFIYNVLESIKMMAEIDEEYEISDSVTSLGKLMRYSMRWTSGTVKFREELEYIRNYLALMNLRNDFEVILSLNFPEDLMEQEMPKMSLQPVVENAILHGIAPVAADATIYIKGWYEDGDCVIEVTDAGRGMKEEELAALETRLAGKVEPAGGDGNGIGLKNVQDRIRMAFGEPYGLSFFSQYGCYTKVVFRLPERKGNHT